MKPKQCQRWIMNCQRGRCHGHIKLYISVVSFVFCFHIQYNVHIYIYIYGRIDQVTLDGQGHDVGLMEQIVKASWTELVSLYALDIFSVHHINFPCTGYIYIYY